jgi:hypothetical protein
LSSDTGSTQSFAVPQLQIRGFDKTVLKEGDVLLFAEASISSTVNPVKLYQQALFRDKAVAKWTHVALWDGRQIVDLWPDTGVRVYGFEYAFGEYDEVLVRRLVDRELDTAKLSKYLLSAGQKIFQFCPVHQRLLAERLTGVTSRLSMADLGEKLVCSTFVERAMLESARFQTFRNLPIAVPADFAISPEWESVCIVAK